MLSHSFMYTLSLPDGQTDEAWEPTQSNALSEKKKYHCVKKRFQFLNNPSRLKIRNIPG